MSFGLKQKLCVKFQRILMKEFISGINGLILFKQKLPYILFSSKYSFRNCLSASEDLLHVTTTSHDKINNNHSAMVIFDLKKAFDSVNYIILLHKLYINGI